jgi:CDP-diacylglycerol--glycerol-3-phosphate 3-phosphatidyltransferase
MTGDHLGAGGSEEREAGTNGVGRQRVTIPNAICLARILAAPGLIVLAASARRSEVVMLFLVMAASDWIDGKLAVALDQRSEIGPWLDSVADAVMYTALLIAAILLEGDRLRSEWLWVVVPVALYLIAGASSVAKFGRWPNHHTRMAKISWGLMLVGAVAFLGAWSLWPLRAAFIGATLASVQSMMITRILPEWRPDVPSVSAARAFRGSSAS